MPIPRHGARALAARLSRRDALRRGAFAGSAIAAISVVGCNEDKKGSILTPVAAEPGGTLRFGTSLPIAYGLDPHVEQAAGLAIFPKVYGYLLHVDPRDDSVVYDHARDYEQPDDGTFIFHLRAGLHFHNIAPLNARTATAADVVASVERFRNNPLVTDKTWHSTILDAIETVDDRTVRVRLKRPYTYTPNELGAPNAGAILPRDLIERGVDIAEKAIGSGPFRADAVDVAGGFARIVRAGDYFGEPANLDAMQWRVYGDDAARLEAFRLKDVDVVPNRDKNEARLLSEFSPEVDVVAEPSLAYLSLGLRVDRPPFIDERVRRAIDMLIDRDELIRELAFGDGDILGPVNPRLADGYWSLPRSEIAASRNATAPAEERVMEAKRLLAAASATDATFVMQVRDVPDLVDVAALVRNQLMRGGVRVDVRALPALEWFLNFRGGSFDATLISHLPYESPDYPTRFFHSKGIDGASNMFGFADATIDGLVERSWTETGEQRRDTLLEAQRRMLEARPMLQLFTGTGYSSAWGYVRNRDRTHLGSMAQYEYRQWLAPDAPGRS